jgi:hypothetical protein
LSLLFEKSMLMPVVDRGSLGIILDQQLGSVPVSWLHDADRDHKALIADQLPGSDPVR